jgi:uncharacterized protein (TIGR01777 family)
MKQKILIAGGFGFIGQYLSAKYKLLGYEVIIIARQNGAINWQDELAILNALENSIMVINLAGKSVDCRYNEKNKAEIFSSRVSTTAILGSAISKCKNPPLLWINSSTATIYRHAEDRCMTEESGEIGTGFSVEVAKKWEKTFFDFNLKNTRQVALRMAIVLGKNGGVIKPLTNLVKFGLGGKQGDGNQMFSWIHIEDVFNIIEFIKSKETLTGVVNTSAPNPITNNYLMKCLRKVLGVKLGLPSPKWLLEIGAIFIKTETELVLKSRWVVPERLLKNGFTFSYPKIEDALTEIYHS